MERLSADSGTTCDKGNGGVSHFFMHVGESASTYCDFLVPVPRFWQCPFWASRTAKKFGLWIVPLERVLYSQPQLKLAHWTILLPNNGPVMARLK